jgi:heme/copper-type cytochrome/quinol oxidase subunit 1
MFLILGVFLLIVAFFFRGDAYEFQFYDSYFIIGWGAIFMYLGGFCCLVQIIYRIIESKAIQMSKISKRSHFLLTGFSIMLLFHSQFTLIAIRGMSRRYFMVSDYETISNIFIYGVLSIVLFSIGQFIFIWSIIKSKNKI